MLICFLQICPRQWQWLDCRVEFKNRIFDQHVLTLYIFWDVHKHVLALCHNDVFKWKHFLRYWPFVPGIHRPSVNSPHKGQWRGALVFPLICAWINGWVNNRKVGDVRRQCAHYYVTVMTYSRMCITCPCPLYRIYNNKYLDHFVV